MIAAAAASKEATRATEADELTVLTGPEAIGTNERGRANDTYCIKRRELTITDDDGWRVCHFCFKVYCPLKICQASLNRHVVRCKEKREIMLHTLSV